MSDIKATQAEIDLLLNSADAQLRAVAGKPDGHAGGGLGDCGGAAWII